MSRRNLPRVLVQLFVSLALGLPVPAAAQTQSHVFVKNGTPHPLRISKSKVSGAEVGAGAWTQGAEKIAPGGREIVLTLNRKGKVNWMDPTPRFLEPGKEIVLSTRVSREAAPDRPVILLQKLLGTGVSTEIRFAVGAESGEQRWYSDASAQRAGGRTAKSEGWTVDFRSYREDGETHVEYTFRQAE